MRAAGTDGGGVGSAGVEGVWVSRVETRLYLRPSSDSCPRIPGRRGWRVCPWLSSWAVTGPHTGNGVRAPSRTTPAHTSGAGRHHRARAPRPLAKVFCDRQYPSQASRETLHVILMHLDKFEERSRIAKNKSKAPGWD